MQSERQRQEEYNRKIAEQFTEYVQSYPIHLPFPAKVSSSTTEKPLRTNVDLVQHRLLEAGVLFEDLQKVDEVTTKVAQFIQNMDQTGCYNAVQVKLEDSQEEGKSNLHVILNEKNWYRLYIGGGLKQDGIYNSAGDGLLPKVQFETTGSLLNLGGHLDKTSLSYTVDQTSSANLTLMHECPLYSFFPEDSLGYQTILSMEKGSQISLHGRAVLDTIDHEWTRSYKEYQRLLSIRISNGPGAAVPEMVEGGYTGLDWSFCFRDVIPRRHISLPYCCDASPEVVAQSGPNTKNSITFEHRTNGTFADHRFNPTAGIDFHTKLEVAGPPGDVGFVKAEGGMAAHVPWSSGSVNNEQVDGLAFHLCASSGILSPITFGGLCGPPTISDRYFIGGPMQLRGFVPSGIGPRAKTGGASTPGGDALGGSLFYTATVAASIPIPAISFLQESKVRLFCFANIGSLTGLTSLSILAKTTRASVGGGVCMGTPFGRMEATYAVPVRYGPRDARRAVQFGLGFSFG